MNPPNYEGSKASAKIKELLGKRDDSLQKTQYVNVRATARLIATVLKSYRMSIGSDRWGTDERLRRVVAGNHRFHLVLAAVFDLITNVEYCHGRISDSNWIYCDAEAGEPRAYYSFLKQCPRCCLTIPKPEPRLDGAQHKPSSHHIGEITTATSALLLRLILASGDRPLAVAAISDQQHDVDVIAYNEDSLILFEIKASPMVTYPVARRLAGTLFGEKDGEPVAVPRHTLVTIPSGEGELGLFVPHRALTIPLGARGAGWPYPNVTEWFSDPAHFLDWLSGWLELYDAYRVPKTKREGADVQRAFLVNGWGDEIDSNKTKPGLGRTDDIKKGTYQLLKFGAQYRDDAAKLVVRGALLANLDPLFLRADYLDDLIGIRWGHDRDFAPMGTGFFIEAPHLRFLYDGILAFNEPVLNDPFVRQAFDIGRADRALLEGNLDAILDPWLAGNP